MIYYLLNQKEEGKTWEEIQTESDSEFSAEEEM